MRFFASLKPHAWLACFYAVALCWIVFNQSTYFSYGYDWDPGDGDVLNLAMRILKGLPIYGSWERAEIMSLYPPLYAYTLALFTKLGLEPMAFARMFGSVLIIASSVLVVLTTQHLLRNQRYSWTYAFCAGLVHATSWRILGYCTHVRPDALTFFLVLLGARIFVATTFRPWAAALIALLAFLAKQSGAALVGALFCYLVFFRREHLRATSLWFCAFAVPTITALEIFNHGYFLRSVWWDPQKYFGSEKRLAWSMFFNLIKGSYTGTGWWVIPLAITGLVGLKQLKIKSASAIVLVFAWDLLYTLKAGRHYGATQNYFWSHFAFVSISSGVGAAWLAQFIYLKKPTIVPLRTAATLLAVPILFLSYSTSIKSIPDSPPPNLAEARDAAQQHNEHIARLASRVPEGRWLAERAPTALLRTGRVVDREMCSAGGAIAVVPTAPGADHLASLLRSGYFTFVQTGRGFGCGNSPKVEAAYNECFNQIGISHVVFYGKPTRIEILQYKGSCSVPAKG